MAYSSNRHLTALLSTVLIIILTDQICHSFGSPIKPKGGARPHDITERSELTKLYNKQVVRAERVRRPLWGLFRHEGVRIQTAGSESEPGRSWLIHKGKGYGSSHQTVVTDAEHMSNKWKVVEGRPVEGKTVADFIKAGGRDYNLLTDNCLDAAKNMMKQTG
ncbi:uncharacterized protein LOC129714876 [Leucoraja erinacea]|uniref:uncharacterized protein LOC129714876 n=1 Tax=Leucoraja erinaceus TaxID=7782 RepID=UPI0024540027|nr:uncharacterized protein LOC129714876 [Leucoraja erinacea]